MRSIGTLDSEYSLTENKWICDEHWKTCYEFLDGWLRKNSSVFITIQELVGIYFNTTFYFSILKAFSDLRS